MKGGSRAFLSFFGILVIAVGVLWFIPGLGDLVVWLFNVNKAVAIFNIAAGAIALAAAFAGKRS